MIHVMLSLDLANAEQQRDAFNKALADEGFIKLTGVNTVWTYTFPNEPEQRLIDQAARVIRDYLRDLVEELGIEKVSYVAEIGNSSPVGAVIEKIRGAYKVEDYDPAQSQ